MQVLSTLSSLALLAATSTADTILSPGDYHKCWGKDPQIPWAISKLCNHEHLYSPGPLTSGGQQYGNIHIKILGNCHPIKHVGPQMCKNRFIKLCADQGDFLPSVIRQDYGGGCTKYVIEGTGGPRAKIPAHIQVPKGWRKPKKHHKHKKGGKKGKKHHGKKKHHKGKKHHSKKKKHGKREEDEKWEDVFDQDEIFELLKADIEGNGTQVLFENGENE